MSVVRTVSAVVLAVALLAASLPAIDDARRTRSERGVDAAAERVSAATARLTAESDPVGRVGDGLDPPAARVVVAVDLPEPSIASAGIGRFALDGEADAVRYRVRGGRERIKSLPVDLYVAGDRSLWVFGEPGSHRLRLRLRRDESGDPAVVLASEG